MNSRSIIDHFIGMGPLRRMRRKRALSFMIPASIGLGVGAAVGIGVGMLLAPRSGAETRTRLRHRARRLGERAREVREELSARADGIAEQMSEGMHRVG